MRMREIIRVIPFKFRKRVPELIYRHLYFQGLFTIHFEGKPFGKMTHLGTKIENEIFWRGLDGGHEPLSMKLWIHLIREIKPRFILDIGANTGIYGIIAKLIEPNAQVLFFEPASESIAVIQKSLAGNRQYTGFKIYDLALSNSTYLAKGAVATGSKIMPHVFLEPAENHVNPVTRPVRVSRLDDLIKSESLTFENIDLVKIDIEGHESKAIEGFGEFFSKSTIFLIEILDSNSKTQLERFFPSNEYYFINIDDDRRTLRLDHFLQQSLKWNVLIIPRKLSEKYSLISALQQYS